MAGFSRGSYVLLGSQGTLGADFLRGQHAIFLCGDNRLRIQTHAIAPSAQENIDRLLRQAGYREVVMESQPLLVWRVPVRIGGAESTPR